jgi:hypothetical protein
MKEDDEESPTDSVPLMLSPKTSDAQIYPTQEGSNRLGRICFRIRLNSGPVPK